MENKEVITTKGTDVVEKKVNWKKIGKAIGIGIVTLGLGVLIGKRIQKQGPDEILDVDVQINDDAPAE